jgi:hypothetical protein
VGPGIGMPWRKVFKLWRQYFHLQIGDNHLLLMTPLFYLEIAEEQKMPINYSLWSGVKLNLIPWYWDIRKIAPMDRMYRHEWYWEMKRKPVF